MWEGVEVMQASASQQVVQLTERPTEGSGFVEQ